MFTTSRGALVGLAVGGGLFTVLVLTRSVGAARALAATTVLLLVGIAAALWANEGMRSRMSDRAPPRGQPEDARVGRRHATRRRLSVDRRREGRLRGGHRRLSHRGRRCAARLSRKCGRADGERVGLSADHRAHRAGRDHGGATMATTATSFTVGAGGSVRRARGDRTRHDGLRARASRRRLSDDRRSRGGRRPSFSRGARRYGARAADCADARAAGRCRGGADRRRALRPPAATRSTSISHGSTREAKSHTLLPSEARRDDRAPSGRRLFRAPGRRTGVRGAPRRGHASRESSVAPASGELAGAPIGGALAGVDESARRRRRSNTARRWPTV